MEDVPAGLVLAEVVVRERGGVLEAAPEGLEPARLEVVGEVKFFIKRGSLEIITKTYTLDNCISYRLRTIPGLFQPSWGSSLCENTYDPL